LKGDTGDPGSPGPKGDTGEAGIAGPQGVKGDTGDPGAPGLKGDTGAVGPAGPKGDQGDTGAVGPAGPKGDQGNTGAIGPAGTKGDKGDTGAVGPAGPQGEQGTPGTSSWVDGAEEVTTSKKVIVGNGVKYGVELTLTCDGGNAGTIRWTGSDFEGCTGTDWVSLTYNPPLVIPTVTSDTGQVWMDRNLGASRVAQSIYDSEAYGDLYQWGRGQDGHEQRTSGSTVDLSVDDVPGHGDFIVVSGVPGDWRSGQNDTLWQGVDGTNNPCPSGFRLPTRDEWAAEVAAYGYTPSGLFASPLKITSGPSRAGYDGSIRTNAPGDAISYYWTHTTGTNDGYSQSFAVQLSEYTLPLSTETNETVQYISTFRHGGYSVRCIKN
ncbi:MAG: hypothetical protein D3922_10410, partial [Candidatus Electrothrix sp. AR1]|nr:hypothetical protein [Candidatus Electrothrix sp. AR1]